MASAGLSRRRVPNGTSTNGDDEDGSSSSTPAAAGALTPTLSHAGSAFQGGSKIAFDPRDLEGANEDVERLGGKVPRLTIMEEVLLLGIKDKQASALPLSCHRF